MAKKPKGNLLESLLRYEIILVLFTLIGVYYFLTFSPVRMPRKTITSPTIELPLPPAPAKKPDTAVSRTIEIKMEKKPPTPPAIPPIKKKAAVVTPIEPETTTTGANNKAAAGQKADKPKRQQPVAAKPGKKSYVIQAGIFIFPETLKHYQQILQDHGYASFVTTRKRLLPMHRVFLGPYPNL
ncbi:MAG: SPOR domain-containing protein, partial [Deltaproteobacteria bacterium]|nr:SPOR domain-containing protein [Deltaproteobacteria bacterium]